VCNVSGEKVKITIEVKFGSRIDHSYAIAVVKFDDGDQVRGWRLVN